MAKNKKSQFNKDDEVVSRTNAYCLIKGKVYRVKNGNKVKKYGTYCIEVGFDKNYVPTKFLKLNT